MANGGIQTFSVVALGAMHGTPAAVANIGLSGFLLFSAAGVLLGGIIADRTPHHERVAAVGFAFTSTMAILLGWVDMPAAVLIFVMSLGGLLNGIIQPSRDMMVRAVTPPGSFGKVFGFVTTGFNLGGMVAPLLYGWLMDRGQPRMIFAIVVAFILLALVTAITRRKPQACRMDSLTLDQHRRQAEALARRYGAAVPPAGPWNETIATLLDHRSVRGFLPDPVPAGTLETLIAAAQSAATSSNMQLWSAIAVTDPAKRKVLAEIAGDQKHIEQCPLYHRLGGRHVAQRADVAGREGRPSRTCPGSRPSWWPASMPPWPPRTPWSPPSRSACAPSISAPCATTRPRSPSCWACRRKAFVVFGLCVGYADPAGEERGQAAPAAIDRAAPRALRRRARGPRPPGL